MPTTNVGVKLDEETRARLKRLGAIRQRSTHWLMKDAIDRYLETEELYEREKAEDLERWQRYADTGNAISHEAMKKHLERLRDRAAREAEAR